VTIAMTDEQRALQDGIVGQVVTFQAASEGFGGRAVPFAATSMIDTGDMDLTGVLCLENPHHVDLTRVGLVLASAG
jgi:hypothetical protein